MRGLCWRVCCAHGELAETVEPIETPLARQTHVGPLNLVLDEGPDASTGKDTFDENMCRFIAKYMDYAKVDVQR